jgi:ABC-2 type transport system ATP-binding protein
MSAVLERVRDRTPPVSTVDLPAISMRDVSKRFPIRRGWVESVRHPFRQEWAPVVQSVTCDVRIGEFFGVLGPNGAGKTTLFRMLASTVLPDSGSIHVAGHDVIREARAARRVLTAVPAEERSLNWRLSARENLNLFGVLHGLRGGALRRRVDELLETVELADAGSKIVAKFSSGMKQRLMIARALLGRPHILLLDEPTRSLDPISARRLRQFLKSELVARQGCTIVMATHNHEEALELCDRVAVLNHGRLLAVGQASALAAELQGERYHVWTRTPDHPVWAELLRNRSILTTDTSLPRAGEWTPVEISVSGGADAASKVLSSLAQAGVPIARFVPVQMTLADLIEQIVHRADRGGRNA